MSAAQGSSSSSRYPYERVDKRDEPPLYRRVVPRRLSQAPFLRRLASLLFFVCATLYVLYAFTISPSLPASKASKNYKTLLASRPAEDFSFKNTSRPTWLDSPPSSPPLRIRVSVISGLNEFERRMALREAVFKGVPVDDVQLTYKFVVGQASGLSLSKARMTAKIRREAEEYGDMLILDNVEDVKMRLGEKRWEAIKWGGSVPQSSYDWYLNLDSDTFVRFKALAQRLTMQTKAKNLNPQNQSILVGAMGAHLTYFETTVPDRPGEMDEDQLIKGPWFPYPLGIGYMLSQSLVSTLLSIPSPGPPHHIHYPSDDVMIGAWVAALRDFHDPSIHFETTPDHSPPPIRKVVPKPYLPHAVHTEIIDDKEGWHNYLGRQDSFDGPFGWASVALHHVSGDEMRAFREMEEIRGEWES